MAAATVNENAAIRATSSFRVRFIPASSKVVRSLYTQLVRRSCDEERRASLALPNVAKRC